MRIFVTGGTGFIGSHFVKLAIRAGHDVIALRRSGSRPPISMEIEPRWVEAPLDRVPTEYLKNVEALVHFAAHGVVEPQQASWDECFFWNVTASLKLWQNAQHAGVKRFLICGSCFEYGSSGEKFDFVPPSAPLEPTGPYHSSKAAATMAAIGFAVDKQVCVTILRPFHVYGEGEAQHRFWPSLLRAASLGEDFNMTEGNQLRDFQPVEETAQAFLAALDHPTERGKATIKNLGSGTPVALKDFANYWWNYWQASGTIMLGQIPYRANEVMRFVPELHTGCKTYQ